MTDLTSPGEINAVVDNKSIAHSISKAGGHSGYVVDGTDIATFYSDIDTTSINAFAHLSTSGLDMTFDGGEAFVYGWLCRDTQTTVSLPSSSVVTVSVGFNANALLSAGETPADNDNVILDTDAGFDADDPKLPLYEVETTDTAVSSVTDVRPLGQIEADSPWISSTSDLDLSTLTGPVTIDNDNYRNHLRLNRDGVGEWEFSPTTGQGGALELNFRGNTTTAINFTESEHIKMGGSNFWAAESADQITIFTQSTDPSNDYSISEGDLWIQTG